MPINVTELLQEFIRNLLSNRSFAAQYAEDPNGMLAAQGVTDHDLSAVDMQGAVRAASADPSVPPETRSAVQSAYSGGGAPAGGGHSQGIDQVVQHLNYITYQTYEGDDYITNIIDNSVDIEGTVFGDVDVDNVSGDNNQIVEGDVENSVVGNDNETAQVQGSADGSTFNFGDGDVSNVSGNTLGDGSAISTGEGDVSSSNVEVEDNDTTVTTEISDDDVTVDSHDTVTAIQDNDTTVNEDNDIAVVEDNDTAISGDDTIAAQ